MSNTQASKENGELINPTLFPEGICTSCQKITLHRLLETDRTPLLKNCLWFDYPRVPTNCSMCRIIFNSIQSWDKLTENTGLWLSVDDDNPGNNRYTGRRIHKVLIRGYYKTMRGAIGVGEFRIYADPNSYASNFVLNRRASLSNLSSITFQKIARWIQDCGETHPNCRDHPSQPAESEMRCLPTRIVHVGSTNRNPHLHISETQQNDRYVALSHCWGEIPQIRTLKANIEQYKEEIIVESLSKTFQDALYVTRRLGIDYIWIDSLCIVQDDKDDWLRESERMGSIYANAYITLAATSAADGNGGLDSVRPSFNWVKFPCHGSDETQGYMWFTDASWTFKTDLDEAPLNTRGWVFQEKILSQRIIHFASSQVYWECRQRFFGEEYDNEVGYVGGALKPSRFWAILNAISHLETRPFEPEEVLYEVEWPNLSMAGFYEAWRSFVGYYSTRNFTKKSDRLIALLGVIQVVEKQTGLRCIDGHWKDDSCQFVLELMWFPKEQRALSVLDDDTRSRMCSSWSWASLEGPIEKGLYTDNIENFGGYDPEDCDLHLMAIEGEAHLPWPSHPLKVSGMLKTVYRGEHGVDEFSFQHSKGRRIFSLKPQQTQIIDGKVCFDCEDEEPMQFYFSPVYRSWTRISCLALLERHTSEIKERHFERVGVGHIELPHFDYSERGLIESFKAPGNHVHVDFFEACEEQIFYLI